ncbi:MAG: glycosyltransferase family 2 protein [Tannerellaceae bacterium]
MKVLFWLLLFLVFYTYIGYGILLWIMVKIKKVIVQPNNLSLPDPLPDVTLLIAAYNEQDIVSDKMINCDSLDYPKDKLHIVWVTDGTTDNTNALLAQYPNVTVLFEPARKGKTAALNRAVPYIKTSYSIFTDANTMLNKQAIKEIVLQFSDPKVGCVAGEKRIFVDEKANNASSGEGFYWKYESTLKSLDSQLNSAVGAAGELFAIRTELYEQMEEDTLLDDFILSLRIAQKGYKIAYCDTAYATETGSANFKEEQKRKVRIVAGGLQSIARMLPLLNIFKYGLLSFQYISHRVLRWTITPIALFILLPLNFYLITIHAGTLYTILFVIQIVFYIMVYFGFKMQEKNLKNKYLSIPYYVFFMNYNALKGAAYLKKRKGNAAWEKSKRS